LIEFVSANPTGPLHIGHGRGAALGDSMARIMRFLGMSVETEYYVNDQGNQMDILARPVDVRLQALEGKTVEFPADGYQGDYIIDIARRLRQEKKHLPLPAVKAYAIASILETIRTDLALFGVSFDHWYHESALHDTRLVDRTLAELTAKEYLYEQENAVWFKSTAFGDEKDRVIKRADGRLTYLASDIAYHALKIERGFHTMVNIWGADHHGYVARVKASVAALGKDPRALHILLYQLVSLVRDGKPVAMSTRSGQFITLRDVLDEVGKDACRFFFAMRSPQSQLEFDLELAKKQSNENPVFYVQYVHARICSIFKGASPNDTAAIERASWQLLACPEERDLMKKLAAFTDTLQLCAGEMSPHHLTRYLLDIAASFHKFYDRCRVLTEDPALTQARLALINSVKRVIAQGLDLLGVSSPETM
jgi:arginyl-tRNA synthetase